MALRLSDQSENVPRPKKTVDQTYTKLTQLEHVLLRPDTYIGSAERAQHASWTWDDADRRMKHRDVTYAPGLYKIFDEILVNAADHAQRDAGMDALKVDIDPENNAISVWNNGAGIPIEMHKKEKVYVPELIFGHLLTSSNYDDNEKKVVGGRNGFGAKLANIFSTEFILETADSNNGKRYKQTFRNNMSDKDAPVIRSFSKKDTFTKITFSPDLTRFGMTCLDSDIVAVMKKRVYDIAGVNSKLKVYLNGVRLPIKSFKDYVALYPIDSESPIQHERINDRWEVAITASDGQLNQVSFVNSIWTSKGGTHVGHIADQVVAKIIDHVSKKHKGMTVKPFQVKSHLSLFINCLIENPSFDSQTKEALTTKASKFGSKWSFSDELAKKVISKSTIVENVLAFAKFKQSKELAKTDGGKKARITGIPKLDDANKAGSREAAKCTLILTEGDSAKALAISGLSVVGRDYFGVFPLRGKLLNVREAKHKQIMENAEINNLKKILGLQHNKTYTRETVKSLRYGHVLIMTDQDHDGSHIKGLLINFFDTFWPSLLKIDGFMQEFITPIVKCVKGAQDRVFFTIPEYKNWSEGAEASQRGWRVKYYKGLGTSTSSEAKAYFSNLPRHRLEFEHRGEGDCDSIELAFSKQRVNDRKEWLSSFEPGTFFDHSADELNYSNFVNKELILFSVADNERSIPSVIDGLKPSQRKVMYACFKRKLSKTEIKVVQLAGYVSEHAAYHHGEASLQATIVGLAQNFVGSNNINMLVPAGQFGTRLAGGKDAASSRYIFTKLSPITRALIPELDDPLLDYLEEDGLSIEPKWYCPVIPMVLVNGSSGIGTGWSSDLPCYNPRDLIRNLRNLLAGRELEPLQPWYRGFTGTIVPVENSKSFDVYGSVRKCAEENTFKIDELPIRSWTSAYKEFLEGSIIGNSDAKAPFVKDFRDNGTEDKVRFTFSTTTEHSNELTTSAAYKKLKLSTSLSTNNMVLFDHQGRIRRYESPEEILKEFYDIRLGMYEKRRVYLLSVLTEELMVLDNKQRFILMVINDELKVAKRKKKDLIADLQRHKFDPVHKKKKARVAGGNPGENEEGSDHENEQNDASEVDSGYNYLLSMPLWSLTFERVAQLKRQRDDKEASKRDMERTTGTGLWEKDLVALEDALLVDEQAEAKAKAAAAQKARKNVRTGNGKRGKAAKAAVVYEESDEEIEQIELPVARVIVPKKPRVKKAETTAAPAKPRAKRAAGTASASAGAPAAARKRSADEEILGSDDDSENEAFELANDDDDDDDMEITEVAPKPRPTRPTRGARKAAVVVVDDSDDFEDGDAGAENDDDDDDDFEEEIQKVTKAAPAPKRAARGGRKKVTVESDDEADEAADEIMALDDDDDIEAAPVPPKRAPAGRKKVSVTQAGASAKLPPKPAAASKVDSDSDEEFMSLGERLAKRLTIQQDRRSSVESGGSVGDGASSTSTAATMASAATESQTSVAGAKPRGRAAAKHVKAPPKRKTGGAAAVSAAAKKGTAGAKRGSAPKTTKTADMVEIGLSPGKSPMPKKSRMRSPVHKAPAGRRRPAAKVVDEDDEDDEIDGVEVAPVTKAPARGRPKRAATVRKIIVESSAEEDEDDEVEFVGSDDDSDFE